MLWQIKKVLHGHFPDLREHLMELFDPRVGVQYSVEELILAGIMLFLMKNDSRNAFNHKQKDSLFRKNYYRLFRLRLPHMDAVDKLLEKIDPAQIENIRCRLIHALIEKRVLHKFRFYGTYFYVAIDGTGVYNWNENTSENILDQALTKESRNGKESYSFQVLEAVLVCSNGMTIPLISEWIANYTKPYDKQDCELKAFKRLAVRLKNNFPRLNICILADGLYSNVSMMDICRQYDWKFITVFRDGNLPSVWNEVECLLPLAGATKSKKQSLYACGCWITRSYRWIREMDYKNHPIHWIECVQETVHDKTGEIKNNRFVFLSNLEVSCENIVPILMAGRARWLIEDHFNSQKNRGGSLHHKFNRTHFNALRNWHNVRQLACMILELVKHTDKLRQILKENTKMTLKELWENLTGYLSMCSVMDDMFKFELWSKSKRQIRLE